MEHELPEAMTDLDRQDCFASYFTGIISEYPESARAAAAAAARLNDDGMILGAHMQLAASFVQDSLEDGVFFGNAVHRATVDDALIVGLQAYGFSGLRIDLTVLWRPVLLLGKTITDAQEAMIPTPARLATLAPDRRDRLQLNALLAARSLGAHGAVAMNQIRALQRRLSG